MLRITNVRTVGQDEPITIEAEDGIITSVGPATGTAESDVDGLAGLITPAFVDSHFHPDKALTRPRVGPMNDLSIEGSLARGARIKSEFTVEDINRRASTALDTAISLGIGYMRAQVDVDTSVGLRGMEAMLEVKRSYQDRIDLQLVAFPQQGLVRDPGALPLLKDSLSMGAEILGGGPDNEGDPALYRRHLESLFSMASDFDVPMDLHSDMNESPTQRSLELIAKMTSEYGMAGKVNVVHCCALGAYDDEYALEVIDLVAQAGIQVCICPIANLQLMGDEVNPRGRGISRPKELLAAGVNVAAGSDNLHDLWFRFGNLDPLFLALMVCLSGGMKTDREVSTALEMVTTRAARYIGLDRYGLEVGAPADFVVLSHPTIEDALRGAPGSRTTFKRGRQVGKAELTLSSI